MANINRIGSASSIQNEVYKLIVNVLDVDASIVVPNAHFRDDFRGRFTRFGRNNGSA